jgi:hypothetical protein
MTGDEVHDGDVVSQLSSPVGIVGAVDHKRAGKQPLSNGHGLDSLAIAFGSEGTNRVGLSQADGIPLFRCPSPTLQTAGRKQMYFG